jgi:ankyrin repeat protein
METEAAMETQPPPAFFLALRHGDTVTVRNMLSTAGAQSWIDWQSDLGYTPLYIAALLNQPSITEQLIVARCHIDLHREDGATPLIIAAAYDKWWRVESFSHLFWSCLGYAVL